MHLCFSAQHDEQIADHRCFPFLIEDEDHERGNVSARHIDFMVGSSELAVDGVTADGERVPVLRNLTWQI